MLAVQDAKAQLHYYECHQHDTNQKVRGCQSSSAHSKAYSGTAQAVGMLAASCI